VVGLGSGGGGWLETLEPTNPYSGLTSPRLSWPDYSFAVGESRPVACDVDGDSKDEIVIGLGSFPSNGGWLEVKDDTSAGYANLRAPRVKRSAYNSSNGLTRPAVQR